ncbi:hypothetical protein CABS01_05976 [Colletotrichum abscissum]|nr:hypothetical protein CABS01_05976 [Colletotrichum abscissum]
MSGLGTGPAKGDYVPIALTLVPGG